MSTQIIEIKPLLDITLLEKLNSRYIDIEQAKRFCSEIHYTIFKSIIYGIGFKNDSNGYTIRGNYEDDNMSFAPDDITSIPGNGIRVEELQVFQDFTDFLSWLTCRKIIDIEPDIIVLNKTEFIEKAIQAGKNYTSIYLNLNNDRKGKVAAYQFKQAHPGAINQAEILYPWFKNYNEHLMKIHMRRF